MVCRRPSATIMIRFSTQARLLCQPYSVHDLVRPAGSSFQLKPGYCISHTLSMTLSDHHDQVFNSSQAIVSAILCPWPCATSQIQFSAFQLKPNYCMGRENILCRWSWATIMIKFSAQASLMCGTWEHTLSVVLSDAKLLYQPYSVHDFVRPARSSFQLKPGYCLGRENIMCRRPWATSQIQFSSQIKLLSQYTTPEEGADHQILSKTTYRGLAATSCTCISVFLLILHYVSFIDPLVCLVLMHPIGSLWR